MRIHTLTFIMNWRGRIFSWLGFVLVLALTSCENPNEIGIHFAPDTSRVKVFYREMVMPTSVIQYDSLLTSHSRRLLCGKMDDQNFGNLSLSSFTQMTLSSDSVVIPANATFDSLILTLYSNYSFGPGIITNQTYNFHRLAESLRDSVPYFTFTSVSYKPEIIGTINFTVQLNPDTVMKVMINQEFGQKFFNDLLNPDSVNQKDAKSFIDYFRGIAIIPDPSNNSVIGFDSNSSSSEMKLYYKVDTIAKSYSFQFSQVVNYNKIIQDRTGTALEGIDDQKNTEFHPPDNRAYLQAGIGTVFAVDMSPFIEFADTIPNIIINKASLEIVPETPEPTMARSSSIFLYYSDSTNRRIRSGGFYQGIPVEGGSELVNPRYEDDTIGYASAVTAYTEAIGNRRISYRKLLIYPPETEFAQSVNQLVVDPERIRLKIYYTTTTR